MTASLSSRLAKFWLLKQSQEPLRKGWGVGLCYSLGATGSHSCLFVCCKPNEGRLTLTQLSWRTGVQLWKSGSSLSKCMGLKCLGNLALRHLRSRRRSVVSAQCCLHKIFSFIIMVGRMEECIHRKLAWCIPPFSDLVLSQVPGKSDSASVAIWFRNRFGICIRKTAESQFCSIPCTFCSALILLAICLGCLCISDLVNYWRELFSLVLASKAIW